MVNYFERLPKEERIKMASRGGRGNRTPQLQKAWDETEKIKGLYYEDVMTPKDIAQKYNINPRQVYRILASKPVDKGIDRPI